MDMATTTKTKSTSSPRDTYADVTARVLEALDAGTVMWHKPWVSTDGGPVNIDSNRRYRGINVFLLEFTAMEKGYSSSRWGSYKQIAARGGQVRKGEKGTLVVFWKILRKEDKVDGETQVKKIPFLRHYTVFNEDQADWDDPETDKRRKPAERVERDPIEAAQELLTEYLATGPSLSHGGDRAFYVPSSDSIRLPHIGDFKSAEHYHSTLFHEVTHSTGHSKRLARDGIAQGSFGRFGDAVYSKEELIAEMGAAMLCGVAGIDQAATIPETAAYLAHWRDALRADNKLIVQAAAQAQKAADLVLGTTFDTNKEES